MPGKATDPTSMAEHERTGTNPPGRTDPIVGRTTAVRALAGFITGAVTGTALGAAFGFGAVTVPRIEFLVAGGAGVPATLGAIILGTLVGLTGALSGTHAESGHGTHDPSARDSPERESARDESAETRSQPPHSEASGDSKDEGVLAATLRHLPIYGSVAAAVLMGYTLALIAARAVGSGAPSDQANRMTWNEKNATRIGGASAGSIQEAVLATAYPATRPDNRPRAMIATPDDWRLALAVTPLIARPHDFALVVGARDAGGIASAVATRLGVPVRSLAETAGGPAFDQDDSTANIAASTAAGIAATLESYTASSPASSHAIFMVVNADADPRWALPAGAYAARTGTPILFVTDDSVPAPTIDALRRIGRRPDIYLIGPEQAVSNAIAERLRELGRVVRIAGSDYVSNAVRFAEFYDEQTQFGWGHTGRNAHRFASSNTILVSGDDWHTAVSAAHLAHRGKAGPLLFTARDQLPAPVAYYLWRQRPAFADTPAEGPFSHVWVVGTFDEISYPVQARADYALEIEQYMTLGDSATSGLEALAIAWIILSIGSAIWLLVHAHLRLPEVMPAMRAAWAIFALLFGPIAVWLYIASYHRRPRMEHGGMTMWQRSTWGRTVSATVMMFGFDMLLMVLAVFLLAYRGFPIAPFSGPLFGIGTAMLLMMVGMYLIALLAMLLVFHTPMTMEANGISSYWRALLAGAPVMIATMTVESIGMMPTMWWAQMSFLPGMQMPTDDDVTMWATLLMSVAVAFVVVLPFNYWMVKRGTKQGTM